MVRPLESTRRHKSYIPYTHGKLLICEKIYHDFIKKVTFIVSLLKLKKMSNINICGFCSKSTMVTPEKYLNFVPNEK